MKYLYIVIITLLLFILPSCGPDMTGPQEVKKLEVLSIKSDNPEVHPGDTVISNVLIGKPQNNNEEYHGVWFLCDPKGDGSSSLSFATCMNPKESNLVGLPTVDSETFTSKIPDDILSYNNLKSKYMYILYILCKSDLDTCTKSMKSNKTQKTDSSPFNSDIFKLNLKRIRVVNPEIKITNHNPKIEGIYLNGNLLTSNNISLIKGDNIFKVKIDSTSFDKKTDPDGNLINETIATAWKSNAGKFDYYYTNQKKSETLNDLDENPFSIPKNNINNYKIYVIATDTRGGIDWEILNVTPK